MVTTKLKVKDLFNVLKGYFDIELIAGKKGLNRLIKEKFVNRPCYIFAGYIKDFPEKAVQILGNRDIGFLSSLKKKERGEAITRLLSFKPPALIISWGHKPPEGLIKGCNETDTALMKSDAPSWKINETAKSYIEDQLAETKSFHGNLVSVYGVGLLITGESGIGKSELALDLVERGHRLVADDIVIVKRKKDMLIGEELQKEDILRHNVEIRGVGILNVAVLYGIKGIRIDKRVEMQLELIKWEKGRDYTRIGLESEEVNIMGVTIPKVKIPIIPGKNIATIAEVVAMDYLCKGVGFYFGEIYESELIKKLRYRSRKYFRVEEDEE